MLEGIFEFFSGIGILLLGVQIMGSSLEKITGANIRRKLNTLAKSPVKSFGLGFIVTLLLSSSTAATIMVIGFASAGIVSLYQSICLVIGSNVGTTLTTFLLSLKAINVVEIIASFVFFGILIGAFAKNNVKLKNIGNAVVGLGLLFSGLVLINVGTTVFKSIEGFNDIILGLSNPFLLIFIGIAMTAVLQSGMGTMAVLISLISVTGGGAGLSIVSAAYVVYGANIGTCFTAIIASFSTGTDGKRVAWFHLLFNVIGVVIFTLLTMFTPWLNLITGLVAEPAVQLVLIDFFSNLAIAILLLPLSKPLTKLMKLIIPRSKKEIGSAYTLRTSELEIPTIAIKKLNYGLSKALEEFYDVLKSIKLYVTTSNVKNPKTLKQKVEGISSAISKLYANSVRISGEMSNPDNNNIVFAQQTLNNLGRVHKNFNDIMSQMVIDYERLHINPEQIGVLNKLFDSTSDMLSKEVEIFKNHYEEVAGYNYADSVVAILNISDGVSALNSDIKHDIMVKTFKTVQITEYIYYLNILNFINDIVNNLTDIAVNGLNYFNPEINADELKQLIINKKESSKV